MANASEDESRMELSIDHSTSSLRKARSNVESKSAKAMERYLDMISNSAFLHLAANSYIADKSEAEVEKEVRKRLDPDSADIAEKLDSIAERKAEMEEEAELLAAFEELEDLEKQDIPLFPLPKRRRGMSLAAKIFILLSLMFIAFLLGGETLLEQNLHREAEGGGYEHEPELAASSPLTQVIYPAVSVWNGQQYVQVASEEKFTVPGAVAPAETLAALQSAAAAGGQAMPPGVDPRHLEDWARTWESHGIIEPDAIQPPPPHPPKLPNLPPSPAPPPPNQFFVAAAMSQKQVEMSAQMERLAERQRWRDMTQYQRMIFLQQEKLRQYGRR